MGNRMCIAGGNGFVGQAVRRWFAAHGWEVVVLTRSPKEAHDVPWDGVTRGPWVEAVRRSDMLVNLAGRSVNCRYNDENRRQIYASRLDSTRVLGDVLREEPGAVRAWFNASTATIYRHATDRPQDEVTGQITRSSTIDDAHPARVAPGWQETWAFSVDVATKWEAAFDTALPAGHPVRRVALRMAIVMGRAPGTAFELFDRLARFGLGGAVWPGTQRVSWVHERDFCRAIGFLIDEESITGPVNLAAPNAPINREFMAALRHAHHMPIGLPTMKWQMHLGAWALRTEEELVFKSRWAYPKRLLDAGFRFEFEHWPDAVNALLNTPRQPTGA